MGEKQLLKDYGLRRQEAGSSTDDFKERWAEVSDISIFMEASGRGK